MIRYVDDICLFLKNKKRLQNGFQKGIAYKTLNFLVNDAKNRGMNYEMELPNN